MPRTSEQHLNLETVPKFLTTTKYGWLELVKDGRNTVLIPYKQLNGSSAPNLFRKKLTN